MTQLNFPTNPTHGLQHPQPGDNDGLKATGGIIYQYDSVSNSWNVVGPDNVATTDWVLAQFKDDQTALDKGYDLIAATNDITLDADYKFSETNPTQNDRLESGIRGEVIDDGNNYDDVLLPYLEEWEEDTVKLDSIPGGGSLCVAGLNREQIENMVNLNAFSVEYRHVISILFNDYINGEKQDWLTNSGVGDTLEINYIGSDGNLEYAIYNVTSKRNVPKIDRPDPNSGNTTDDIVSTPSNVWALRVEFQASSDPEKGFKRTSSSTAYNVKVFKKAFTAEGGEINGPLHVIHTSDDAFLVMSDLPNKQPILLADTDTTFLLSNDEYDAKLDYTSVVPDSGIVTYGHLNRRLGTNNPLVGRGPYLPLDGGTLTGKEKLIINRDQNPGNRAEGSFVIRGRVANGSTNSLMSVMTRTDGKSDYIVLNTDDTPKSIDNAILTKKQISDMITGGTGGYIKQDGTVQFTGQQKLVNTSQSDDLHAASVGWVKNRALIVPPTQTDEAGALWSSGGVLYWNKR